MINNLIIRKGMLFLSILTLLLTGFFVAPDYASAMTAEKTVTKYHLDIGVQQIWGVWTGKYDGNGQEIIEWDDNMGRNSSMNVNTGVKFDMHKEISNVKVYPYSSSKFDWNNPNYTSNMTSENYYDDKYSDFKSKAISVKTCSSSGNTANFSYTAVMNSTKEYDLAKRLNWGQIDEVFNLMAGPYSTNPEQDVKRNYPDLYNKLNKGRNGVDPKVRAYMYFCPVIIQYDVKEKVEIGEIDADLTLPATAKTGEVYNAADNSSVEDMLSIEEALLEKRVNGGAWQTVTVWQGTGTKGTNTGGSIEEKSDEICDITYRITVTASDGQTDSAEKTIKITDGRTVSGQAILEVDPIITYEGHPVDAKDCSAFEVNGEMYSAERAYKEGIARNSYSTINGKIRKDGYNAIVTFPKRGYYPVDLYVSLKNGERLQDSKTVEVRKTPYVIDSLGGYQKQNRKQILTFDIATYPDKPIEYYDITIKDLTSNEIISLTKNAPQKNGACIKTRTVKTNIKDKYWTTLTVEFLTKYPRYSLTGEESRRFSYKIRVTDSKGDSDEAYKEFQVAPDKPPVPEISVQTSFVRGENSNRAKLEAEDVSKSDGDQLQRTWYTVDHSPLTNLAAGQQNLIAPIPDRSFVRAEMLNGYENLAFGTNQKIGWNREGVGKTTVKLHVKDIWTEPTLEEYIVPSDYLEAETTACTEVINIAPVVSLEPVSTVRANIGILTKAKDARELRNQTNSLKAALLEKGIDGNVSIIHTSESHEAGETYATAVDNRTSTAVGAGGGKYTFDSEKLYYTEAVTDNYDNPQIKITAAGKDGDTWSTPVPKASNNGNLYIDNHEKYLIYSYDGDNAENSCSYIFDSNTGAFLKEIKGWGISGELFISGDEKRFYSVDSKGIKKFDIKSGKISTVISTETWLPRIYEGKIGFVGRNKDSQYYIGLFDMDTEKIATREAPILDYETNILKEGMSWIKPVDWSMDGKILVVRRIYDAYDGDYGGEAWLLDTKTKKQGYLAERVGDKGFKCFMIKDNYENCNHIGVAYSYAGTTKIHNRWCIYEYGDNALKQAAFLADKGERITAADGGFYDIFTGKIYMYDSGYYGGTACYDLNKQIFENEMNYDMGISPIRTDLHKSEGRIAAFHKAQGLQNYYYISQYKTPITDDEAVYNSIRRNSVFNQDEENYIFGINLERDLSNAKEYIEDKCAEIINITEDILKEIPLKIKEMREKPQYALKLSGNGTNNLASVYKNIELKPNTNYEYSYDVNSSDKFENVFKYSNNTNIPKAVYKEVVYKADLTNGRNKYIDSGFVKFDSGTFFTASSYQRVAGYGKGRLSKREYSDGASISFDLEKDGYIDFVGFTSSDKCKLYVNGNLLKSDEEPVKSQHYTIFLKKGANKIEYFNTGKENSILFKAVEIGYLTGQNNSNAVNYNVAENNGRCIVKGTFTSGKEIAYTVEQSMTLKANNINDLIEKGLLKNLTAPNGEIQISPDGENLFVAYKGYISNSGRYTISLRGEIAAPADKMLIVSYDGVAKILKPSETYDINYRVQHYDEPPHNRTDVILGNFYAVEIPVNTMGITADSHVTFNKNTPWIFKYSFKNDGCFYKIDFDPQASAAISKCRTGYEKPVSTIELTTEAAKKTTETAINNFKLWVKNHGENTVLEEIANGFNTKEAIGKNGWKKKVSGLGSAEMVMQKKAEKEEPPALIYKKGQLVSYKIHYSDRENDPSKANQGYSYRIYAHAPMNDGEHPQAAIIYDEDGNIIKICGKMVTEAVSEAGIPLEASGSISVEKAIEAAVKIGGYTLKENIPRFYVDGKYTVYHWEYDDTSRGNVPGGYPLYDKSSNTESLTFYIEGGASAPWITGIGTSPEKVLEGKPFSINIGIDDAEKDVLHLTTEVYKDNKHIFTHRRKNIYPVDSNGNAAVKGILKDGTKAAGQISYPVTNTGALPDNAQTGIYTIVCTVRDQTGAGIGTYKFTVISEGKIVGEVHHTDRWDENRKKYNIAKFGNEIREAFSYTDYMAMKEPRKRGTNVFWCGEKFMLLSEVAGSPTKVTCSIKGTRYSVNMENTGRKNGIGEAVYEGEIWDKTMMNRWGNRKPEKLIFVFTAYYSGGITKTHEVYVIVDNTDSYWKLHRAF